MRTIPISGATVVGIDPGYAIRVRLSNGGGISIEDPMVVVADATATTVDPSDGNPDVRIVEQQLVGKVISGAGYGDDYTLSILFEGGVILYVTPIDDGFESWSVSVPPDYTLVGSANFI